MNRVILAICCFASIAAYGKGIDIAALDGLPAVHLDLDLGAQTPDWALATRDENVIEYEGGGYRLTVRPDRADEARLLRITLKPPAGMSLAVRGYAAQIRLPLAGLHAVTVPNTAPIAQLLSKYDQKKGWPAVQAFRCRVPEGFQQSACTNADAPFVLVTDERGDNRMAIGWLGAERNGLMKAAADGDRYVVTLERRSDVPLTGERLDDVLYLNTQPANWWGITRHYAQTFDGLNHRQHAAVPAWTGAPVFCTWYCYGDHIDQQGVLKIARKCKEMGFGTILIDAGWDCRPNGGYADFDHGILGDFTAVPERFPDLPGAVRQMHDMGLKVMLWSAPFWQGKESKAYREKTGSWHLRTAKDEDHSLCPRYIETRDYLRERFTWVARTYGIDGMWLDAADSIPPACVAGHKHVDAPMAEAFVDCLAGIQAGLRSVNAEAVTEARVMHANLQSKRGLDVVQPSDAPESFDLLRLTSIQMRAWAHDVVLKNDPMIWKKHADTATIGKFMATNICCGVPALSVDFLTAPAEQCRQTAAWLTFYREHRETLLNGEFKLFGADYGVPDMMLIGQNEAVIYMRNAATREVVLPRRVARVILLNCTDADELNLSITPGVDSSSGKIFRPGWQPIAPAGTASAPSSCRVPQGGAVIFGK